MNSSCPSPSTRLVRHVPLACLAVLLLSPLEPAHAWFNGCDNLDYGDWGSGPRWTTDPHYFNHADGSPSSNASISIYNFKDSGGNVINSVAVTAAWETGVHCMVNKARLTPVSWTASSGGFNNAFALGVKFLPPKHNAAMAHKAAINFFGQIMERSPSGFFQTVGFIYNPATKRVSVRLHGPEGAGGAVIEKTLLDNVDYNTPIEVKVDGFFTTGNNGYVNLYAGRSGGPVNKITTVSNIRTLWKSDSYTAICNAGCYAYPTSGETTVDVAMDVDYVWLANVY